MNLWDTRLHGPIPPGWRAVRYRGDWAAYEVAPRWCALPLRWWLLAYDTVRWALCLRIVVRRAVAGWWASRPRRLRLP